MTDSISRKPEDNTTEKIKARLDKYARKLPSDRVEFSDLPTWVRAALTMHDVLGLSWEEVAKRHGKSAGTLKQYSASPAFQKWRAELMEFTEDPIAMASATMRSSAVGITMDYLAAYEKAIESGDFNATAKMSQDLLDRIGITRKKEKTDDRVHVTLQIGGLGTIDAPVISSTYEQIHDADFELDE